MYLNPQILVHAYRFKSKYLIAERLVVIKGLVKQSIITNTTKYKMISFSAGSELKRA